MIRVPRASVRRPIQLLVCAGCEIVARRRVGGWVGGGGTGFDGGDIFFVVLFSLSHSLSVCLCLSLFLPLSLCPCPCPCSTLCLCLSVSASVRLSLSLSLSHTPQNTHTHTHPSHTHTYRHIHTHPNTHTHTAHPAPTSQKSTRLHTLLCATCLEISITLTPWRPLLAPSSHPSNFLTPSPARARHAGNNLQGKLASSG